ncbi:hypothetical protein [Parasitella parasitica]|uniref:Integrase zinc-binding domain-containing protein n=1 Tax=Parasitella parasitica TaxID=35722 RepID=A0A0B7NUL3_9FUNG|nr:hypothetical protein [Parasitella parasitica]
MEFNFDVIYLKGIDNVLADQLSHFFSPVNKLGENIVLEKDNKMIFKRKNITYKKVNGEVKAIKCNTKNKFDISKHVEYNSGDYFTPPKEESKAILLTAHVFGHFGNESIVKSIHNDGLHWPNLLADAVEMAKSCNQCEKHNITKRGYNPLRPTYSYITGDHWSIDLADELLMSGKGFNI